jgi:tetratricopeptide (TPR) repeat protein
MAAETLFVPSRQHLSIARCCRRTNLQPGDIVAIKHSNNTYGIIKILRIDRSTAGDVTQHNYHCLMYEPVSALPGPEDVAFFSVLAWHAPIAGKSIEQDGKVISNVPVTNQELVGYIEYLKQTNWPQYVTETGFDADVELPQAQQHYEHGCKLADAGQFQEAIDAYSQALDIFPFFIEALDNRGFAKMDLGRFTEAINDFRLALDHDENNPVALFSMGECHFKLGDYGAAEAIFEECVKRWPDQEHHHKFLSIARDLGRGAREQPSETRPEKRPWWKRW